MLKGALIVIPLPKMDTDLNTPITSAPSKNWKRFALIAAIATISVTTVVWYWWPVNKFRAYKQKPKLAKESSEWCESYFKLEAPASPKSYLDFTEDDWFNLLDFYTSKWKPMKDFDDASLTNVAKLKKLAIEEIPESDRTAIIPKTTKLVHPFLLEVACQTGLVDREELKKIINNRLLDITELSNQVCMCLQGLLDRPFLEKALALCKNNFITDAEIIQIAQRDKIEARYLASAAVLLPRRINLFQTFLYQLDEKLFSEVISFVFHGKYLSSDPKKGNETDFMVSLPNVVEIITSSPHFGAFAEEYSKHPSNNPLGYLLRLARNKKPLDKSEFKRLYTTYNDKQFEIAKIFYKGFLKKFHP